VWLNADTLCDQPRGHYPQTNHRGHDPSGLTARWVDYIEQDGHAVEVDRGGGWPKEGDPEMTTPGPKGTP
jgi:hypothetical protein